MILYKGFYPDGLDKIADLSTEEARNQALSYLEFMKLKDIELRCEFESRHLFVHHFKGTDIESETPDSGWVIGGRIPCLSLSDEELENPIEAIAVYAMEFRRWCQFKGISKHPGHLPDYRFEPDWHPCGVS